MLRFGREASGFTRFAARIMPSAGMHRDGPGLCRAVTGGEVKALGGLGGMGAQPQLLLEASLAPAPHGSSSQNAAAGARLSQVRVTSMPSNSHTLLHRIAARGMTP